MTQRGNRRQQTFFNEGDYHLYRKLLVEWCKKYGVKIWAYCLMPNHIHLIAVPATEDGLRRTVGEVHRRYTRRVNFREQGRGHLWQGRFASYAMDERHCLSAARYIEMNPVRAGLVPNPVDYPWSSARAHVLGTADALLTDGSLQTMVDDWKQFLSQDEPKQMVEMLRRYERTGRPLGDCWFVKTIEKQMGRILHPQRAGRPKKAK
ncbi:MAG: transposase [Nanoarchaeota archaeon]|nr:transposase [Nanoarchaeota archaeon]